MMAAENLSPSDTSQSASVSMLEVGTEIGSASASAPASAPPVAKAKRRFAPQLIEQTVKTSNGRRQLDVSPVFNQTPDTNPGVGANNLTRSQNDLSPSMPSDTIPNASQTTTGRDKSLLSKEPNMSDPQPSTRPIRRFVPIPIETTFDSYRVASKNPHGPFAEPTPDPSPTMSQSSVSFISRSGSAISGSTQTERKTKPKRRFAPQLIETTRSSRRAGQEGPAMKPKDKTDITPGTNHIYVLRPKSKKGAYRPKNNSAGSSNANTVNETSSPGSRRERHVKSHSHSRSLRSNSYYPDLDTIMSSESSDSSDDESVAAPAPNLRSDEAPYDAQRNPANTWSTRGYDSHNRRESCDEEFSGYFLGIAAREAHRQRELEQALSAFPNGMPPQGVEHFFARDNSEDDLQIGDDESPLRHGPSQLLRRKSTDPGWAVKEMRAHAETLARMRVDVHTSSSQSPATSDVTPPPDDPLWSASAMRRQSRDLANKRSTGSFPSTHLPVLSARLPPGHDKLFTPPPSTGVPTSQFGTGFTGFPFRAGEPEDGTLGKMRKAASPPMLGGDLTFPTCPSPKYTRMEPNQPYFNFDRCEERQRDKTGATGLWRGYCSSRTGKLDAPSLQPPGLLRTPSACSTVDPFASAFEASANMNEMLSSARASPAPHTNLHMQKLSGPDERQESERQNEEREQALLAEFDESFITQVYNYLSLGYPATARAFDDELSKISGIHLEELRQDDKVEVGKGFMRHMEISLSDGSTDSSSSDGTFSGDEQLATSPVSEDENRPRHYNPRWKALKLYIHEWARQHPSLNDDDDLGPPAWGVRARRGSWAI
ncbi:hypothetical protein GGS21DRAFT_153008 [Xylaria nigripes]|nr:hypothetical protein GGS21DRAFT_153008 [Xylaria nigripes]